LLFFAVIIVIKVIIKVIMVIIKVIIVIIKVNVIVIVELAFFHSTYPHIINIIHQFHLDFNINPMLLSLLINYSFIFDSVINLINHQKLTYQLNFKYFILKNLIP